MILTASHALLASVVRRASEGPIRWSAAPAAWVCAVLAVVLLFVVRAIYRRERVRPRFAMRLLLAGLRLAAIAAVVLALFRPEREIVGKTEDRSRLVLLVDTSASMTTKDRFRPETERALLSTLWPEGGPEPRPETLDLSRRDLVIQALCGRDAAFLRSLTDRFDVDVLAFDQEVRAVASTAPTTTVFLPGGATEAPATDPARDLASAIRALKEPSGSERTDLAGALRSVAREDLGREDRRLAGVILITDGRDTSGGPSPAESIASLGKSAAELSTTIVALGDPSLAHNLKVERIRAKDVILVQDQPAFQAELRHKGFAGVSGVEVKLVVHRIRDKNDAAVLVPEVVKANPKYQDKFSTTLTLGPDDAATPVAPLSFTFEQAGTYDVAVEASLPAALASQDAFAEDNTKHVTIRVKDTKIRVLLADDALRNDSWFLKNILIRESSHPGDPRRVESQVWIQQFDRDVPQPHGPGVPALRAFPSTRQEIFSYDVIILGDIDWRRLAPDEKKSSEILQLMKEFTAEGGGIAFVAGTDRSPDQYLATPLEDLLPVDVSGKDRATVTGDPFGSGSPSIPFRVLPTEIGAAHPILSLAHESADPSSLWAHADGWEWYWLYRTRGGVKLGAQALARVGVGVLGEKERSSFLDDRGDPYVVFATVGYGKGRTFFSALDDVYRIRRENGDIYYGAFWDETIRWLATYRLLGGNRRFKIDTDKDTYFVGETALVRISALDADYKPLTDKTLTGFGIEDPSGKALTMLPSDAPKRDEEAGQGVYRTSVRLSKSGAYRFTLAPPGASTEGVADKRVEVLFATEEARDRSPDHGALEALARATNPAGKAPPLRRLDELDAISKSLEARTIDRVLDRREEPVWDSGWVLWLVAALLTCEWVLRKRLRMV